MQSIGLINTKDVGIIEGNVTIQTIKNNVIIDEQTIHNDITSDGIFNLLVALTRNATCYLTGMKIQYRVPDKSEDDFTDIKYFSQSKVVNGATPYAEFKVYLGTSGADVDYLNGTQIKGARLMSYDNVGSEIIFANVDTSSTYDDSGVDTPVFTAINKTSDIAVMIIWRIGLSSIFTRIIA